MLMSASILHGVLAPLGLGLLGFVEPCTVGSSVLFLGYVERHPIAVRTAQALIFTVVRAIVVGALGAAAAVVGSGFAGFQQGMWIALGALYVSLGTIHLLGRQGFLSRSIGPGLARMSPKRGALALAVLFGLNLPACAAPLLVVLLGSASASLAQVTGAFLSLALFGLALSLPLAVMVVWPRARRLLDRLTSASRRVPALVGLVLVAVGLWSIYLGAVASGAASRASAG
jgi:cytochrome c-type biogenesis protein